MLLIVICFIIYLGSFALGVQLFGGPSGATASAATFGTIVGSIGFYGVLYLIENKSDKK